MVIAGSRTYNNYSEAKNYIDFYISKIKLHDTIIFVSGGCCGADMLGERYAKENRYKIERYSANWKNFGKSAGPKRNKQMAEISDYIICFWDGRSKGTKSMIEYAKKLNKPLRVIKINPF